MRTKKGRAAPLLKWLQLLGCTIEKHGPDVTDGFGWIKALRANIDTVLNTVASKYAKGVV